MTENKRKLANALARYRMLIPALYGVAVVAMIVILCASHLLRENHTDIQYGLEGYAPMDTHWYAQEGQAFDIQSIDDLRLDNTDHISIFHDLPQEITQDHSLVFRSKNCAVTVLINGTAIYETDIRQAPFANHSPGTRWNMVTVHPADAGKTIELRVHQAYADGRAKVDTFYYGDRAAIVLLLIDSKISGFIVSLIIMFVAFLYLFAWIILNWRRTPKNHSLLWLAVFAMIASLWCLLETNLFQFFVEDLRLIQLADNMMLVLGGLALFLYMDSVFQIFHSRVVRLLCGLDIAYILLATLSQFLGLWDLHQTLNGAIGTYAITVVLLIISLAKQRGSIKALGTFTERTFYILQLFGLLLLGCGVLGDLISYLSVDVLDRAFLTRIGLLCFIICFGAGNFYQMVLLVKKGIESDLISHLAYSDGLTQIGNRTAYLEKLQQWQKIHPADGLALVMFDINNLKEVNDTLGHKAGDELILTSAGVLKHAFDAPWRVYRIGGDEFVALLHGANMQAAYEKAITRFRETLQQINETENRTYSVVIAHGVAYAPSITAQTVEAAEKESDQNMYKDKYQLKFRTGDTSSDTQYLF